jgi:hypothetical protein
MRYDTTTQETRSTPPSEPAIAGRAVATMVWSSMARNIGSMTDGKTRKKRARLGGSAGGLGSGAPALIAGSHGPKRAPAKGLSAAPLIRRGGLLVGT